MKKTDKEVLEEILREARVPYHYANSGATLVARPGCAFGFAPTGSLLRVHPAPDS
jgi:hypothetical protein